MLRLPRTETKTPGGGRREKRAGGGLVRPLLSDNMEVWTKPSHPTTDPELLDSDLGLVRRKKTEGESLKERT